MKKCFFTLILFPVILLSSCTINKPAEQEKTISVTGTGTVSMKPDLIYLKFLIRTSDWNVSKAVEKNAANSENVIKAVLEAGVDSSDISTADYKITQDNSKDYPGMYTVIKTLGVIIRNTENAGKVIDVAVKDKTGANGVTSFSYEVSDKTTALRQARTLAVQNAQDAAALLAGASGCKVGSVIDIYENYSTYRAKFANDGGYSTMLASTSIEEETIDITSTVTIKYNLEQ